MAEWMPTHLSTTPFPAPKQKPKPRTIIQTITQFTSPSHERIDPSLYPPWRRTLSLYSDRFTVNPCSPFVDTDVVRKEYLKQIEDYKSQHNVLYIYTDGSKIQKSGFHWVGAAAVAFHGETKVFTSQLGLGGHAEVYNAKMAALSIGATKVAEYICNNP
ncbi:hypothetical protein B0H34DRAFT_752291, partial [Crassisporium funariophilum]